MFLRLGLLGILCLVVCLTGCGETLSREQVLGAWQGVATWDEDGAKSKETWEVIFAEDGTYIERGSGQFSVPGDLGTYKYWHAGTWSVDAEAKVLVLTPKDAKTSNITGSEEMRTMLLEAFAEGDASRDPVPFQIQSITANEIRLAGEDGRIAVLTK